MSPECWAGAGPTVLLPGQLLSHQASWASTAGHLQGTSQDYGQWGVWMCAAPSTWLATGAAPKARDRHAWMKVKGLKPHQPRVGEAGPRQPLPLTCPVGAPLSPRFQLLLGWGWQPHPTKCQWEADPEASGLGRGTGLHLITFLGGS